MYFSFFLYFCFPENVMDLLVLLMKRALTYFLWKICLLINMIQSNNSGIITPDKKCDKRIHARYASKVMAINHWHMHHDHALIMHSFINCHMHYRLWNISPLPEVYYTQLRKRMENKEMAHMKSHYQSELEFVKDEVALLTSLFEQLQRLKNGEGSLTHPPVEALITHVSYTPSNVYGN